MKEVKRAAPVKALPIAEEDVVPLAEIDDDVGSKLEQLVFFNQPDNPLTLEIGPIAGDLNHPALSLSSSLLNGTNSNLTEIMGESKYLHGVVLKCREIMNCISNDGLVYKLTELTRIQLLYQAERMAVMRDLWDYQNEIYTNSTAEGDQGFLESGIIDFLAMKGLEMSVKDFFKKMVNLCLI
jgi:Non-repetitive/WGA-negative nucleoporin C-terminal